MVSFIPCLFFYFWHLVPRTESFAFRNRRPSGANHLNGFQPSRNEIGSLSTRVFETRTATGSELFSLLTCLHPTAFALPSIFSPLEMLGIKIWETPLSWHARCPLPVDVRLSKTCVLKLPNYSSITHNDLNHSRYNCAVNLTGNTVK